jgi:hypothetical protein
MLIEYKSKRSNLSKLKQWEINEKNVNTLFQRGIQRLEMRRIRGVSEVKAEADRKIHRKAATLAAEICKFDGSIYSEDKNVIYLPKAEHACLSKLLEKTLVNFCHATNIRLYMMARLLRKQLGVYYTNVSTARIRQLISAIEHTRSKEVLLWKD